MRAPRIFRRHSRWAEMADAFIDGELSPGDAARFEQHFAGCERCSRRVAAGRELKAALRRAPELRAPRSFAINPQMLAAGEPDRREPERGTPLYLGLARAGAGLAVAAFVTVLTFRGLGSSTGGGADDRASREVMSAQDAGGGAMSDALATAAPATKSGEEGTPSIAPPGTGGDVGGQGAPTARPTPVPPATGREPTPSDQPAPETPIQVQEYADGAIGEAATPDAARRAGEGGANWTAILGAIAGVSVMGLVLLEANRRWRRG